MAARRTTHAVLGSLAALTFLAGLYGAIRSAGDGSSASTPQNPVSTSDDSADGDRPKSWETSGGKTTGTHPVGSGTVPFTPPDREGPKSPGGGTENIPSRESGAARISGPTVDNVYPVERDGDGNFSAVGGCAVLANTAADVPLRIRSLGVQGAAQVHISDDPCQITASDASWNIGLNLTDPVNACSPGTVLEPASRSSRHGCSVRFTRPTGLGSGTATLSVEVTAECASRALRPCSRLDGRYAPSPRHPVGVVVTTTRTITFAADPSAPQSPGTSGTPDVPEASNTQETSKSPDTPEEPEPPAESTDASGPPESPADPLPGATPPEEVPNSP
ncbi:hypothetical protein GCM10017673_04320 [Streptosporangium violaceochromogenes]|nr:hypothetical protein GCM10017673_04320 [Streptosporangium violaceochromogenes]